MKNKPTILIITVVYNGEKYIEFYEEVLNDKHRRT
jgi:hypothetical protein